MSHTFNVTLTENPSIVVARLISLFKENDLVFLGDQYCGQFSGKGGVQGTYHITGNVATITITKKPFLVSWSYVESSIVKYFGSK